MAEKSKGSYMAVDEGKKTAAGPSFSSPTELVTFIIGKGDDQESFKVHKEHVCYHSPVLSAAFNNENFTEGKTQTYCLDDVDPSCFRLFVQWIYKQDFDILSFTRSDFEVKPFPRVLSRSLVRQNTDLIQLWIAADKFLMPRLQNKAIDKLQMTSDETGLLDDLWFQVADESTSESSPLRRYAVDTAILYDADFKSHRQSYSEEMLFDLVEKLIDMHYDRTEPRKTLSASNYYVAESVEDASR